MAPSVSMICVSLIAAELEAARIPCGERLQAWSCTPFPRRQKELGQEADGPWSLEVAANL